MGLGNVDLTPQLVQAVRDAVDVVDVASGHTRLKKAGKRYQGLCPLHKEKTPSFSVDPVQGLFYCFGCGTGGDAIKLHMLLSGDDFPAAIEALAHRYGIHVERRSGGRARDRGPDVEGALEAAREFFREALRKTPAAREYLARRRISEELVERFELGYAPDGWEILLGALRSKVSLDALLAAGLVGRSQKSGKPYDRFRHRLMFPIRAPSGRVVGFGGRTLGDDKAKYVNTAETERFHKGSLLYGLHPAKRVIRESGRAILTEGYFDVIGTVACGAEGAVAGMGTSLTREQAKLLARFAEEVVVAFDGDDAGEKAYRRAIPLLLGEGLAVRQARLGAGHDPDSLRLEAGPEAVLDALNTAEDAVRSEIARLAPPDVLSDPQRQSKAAQALVEMLKPIPDAVLRFGYGRVAADHLGLPVELFSRRLEGTSSGAQPHRDESPRAIRKESGEMRILALLLSGNVPVPEASQLPPPEAFLDPGCRNIYRVFRTLYERDPASPPNARDVLSQVEGDAETVDALAGSLLTGSPDGGSADLTRLLRHQLRRYGQQRTRELSHRIREAQRTGDEARLQELLDEKNAWNRKLHSLP